MNQIGLLGLDTSHPRAFAQVLERNESTTVAGIWDGGDVRDSAYAKEFCSEFDARLYDEPTEMIGDVDAVLVLTVNWDTHRPLAVPFLRAGIPTFIDKPVAGCVEDIRAIADAADGTPVLGGSSVPYHPAVVELPIDAPGRTLFGVGYNGPFYYGVHLTDVARRLAGADWVRVEPTPDASKTVTVEFANDAHVTLCLDGSDEQAEFTFTDVTDATRTAVVDDDRDEQQAMYKACLDSFVATVDGQAKSEGWLLDAAELLLAVNLTLDIDRPVTPETERLSTMHVDGEAFLANYEPYY